MSCRNRFKPWASLIALLCWIAPTSVPAQSPEWPAGPVQAKVRTACTECHDSRIIVQQRLSNRAWSKEVDR